jgi:hypothetical protein
VELARADGSVAACVPLEPDWEPASTWVRFEGMRRGLLPPVLSNAPGEVEPCFATGAGAPTVAALRIAVRDIRPQGGIVEEQIPISYLGRQVQGIVRRLVAAGRLGVGEVLRPRICAEPGDESPTSADGGAARLTLAEIPRALALIESPMADFLDDATPCGVGDGDPDVPLFVPRRVLEDAEALAVAAAEVETGGFLLGHLHRDPALPEIFVEVTAQVPAEHTRGDRTHLTFTPETWAAVDGVRHARGRHESVVAWWHSHPFFCRRCPVEKRRTCTLEGTFFSAEDVALHHLFAAAHQTALLFSTNESGVTRSFFGWRAGSVAARGYYRTER